MTFMVARSIHIHPISHLKASLEMWNPFLGHRDLLTCLRIPAHAWWSDIQFKTAETADLDTSAAGQALTDGIQDGIRGQIGRSRQLAAICRVNGWANMQAQGNT